MNPERVDRSRLHSLTDLPNIGPSLAGTLQVVGIEQPNDLIGQDAYEMYERLAVVTGERHDPCVLDTFISVVRFMAGEDPQPWWAYTAERKRTLAADGGRRRR
jgi:hypothetical protein